MLVTECEEQEEAKLNEEFICKMQNSNNNNNQQYMELERQEDEK